MDHKSTNLGSNLSSSSSSEESIMNSLSSAPPSSVVTRVKTERWEFSPPSVYENNKSSMTKDKERFCSSSSYTCCLSSSSSSASSTQKKNESSPLVKKPGWRRFVSRKQVDDFIFVPTKNQIEGQEFQIITDDKIQKSCEDISVSYSDTQLKPYIMQKAKSMPIHKTTMSVQLDPKVITQAEQVDEFLQELSMVVPSISISRSSSKIRTNRAKTKTKTKTNTIKSLQSKSNLSVSCKTKPSFTNCPIDPLTGGMINNDTLKRVKIWTRTENISPSNSMTKRRTKHDQKKI